MKNITFSDIISTAYGAEAWLPLITKQSSPEEWLQGLLGQSVVTKNGHEMSLVRDTIFRSQMAMTNIALALRAANVLGIMPYTQALKQTRDAQALIEHFAISFAAYRGENHRELAAAEVGIKVKDGCFGEVAGQSDDWITEEELHESGYAYEDIEAIMEQQEANAMSRRAGDRKQGMAEDEGVLRTALHDANQLWDIEPQDIEWFEAVLAKVALVGKDWPKDHPVWDAVTDRLADSWAAALDYADDKEAMAAKVERRSLAIEDLHAKPMMARWVVNHVTRRVWRDMQSLQSTRTRYVERLEELDRQAFAEERYGVPASITRPNIGEARELDRIAYLPLGNVDESEGGRAGEFTRSLSSKSGIEHLGVDPEAYEGQGHLLESFDLAVMDMMPHLSSEGVTFANEGGIHTDLEHLSPEDQDRRWFTAVIEACETQMAALRSIYPRLRELDLSLVKIWELFDVEGTMPSAPPVYWNMKGYYLTEEEALAAIQLEQAEWALKNRMSDDDAAREAVQALMLMHAGI